MDDIKEIISLVINLYVYKRLPNENIANEKYLITYSEEGRTIVGWNGEDIDKVQLKFHQAVKTNEEIKSLCFADDRKLAYINSRLIDMSYCAF
ncbi:hypothetical protein GLOIN_2v1782792 [Rhizophagus irregularis DAOM 181602=DAOM 197198]|uniref:Uncharacterized protein n=1 Tax=Rhizophagus irregularis (strain DAOM 181602 / DAOM 197198 / MUCL 43194) TaxID=747089 RepID=A0A2P4PGM3_RHIID|nr:hypothetical protein GLOIN_2v1782792 [Rhizophagus irregularis DAOM 181602=DAOM 197198]POG64532.1 hypothetical protein GLOIN_2v1782792 [Rhizophagus irregularis DAOM 181602=DAOM 197198]GET58518.1 hypothetical protein GLOIN_2v1782792 [Rhizophagus irregularis DAOM 181602=DAOM 197198]|eukprot:XP_025171398.1 hypothetical protein GLOIN_2v1782792 [Rhizophagus irregularis DAOM 181602=DAOM 197198]